MRLKTIFLIIILMLLSIISLFVGIADISMKDILVGNREALFLFTISRIPRTVTLILSGVGLSVSGMIMQQTMQNKFVSPTTTGALEAAKMGMLASLILFPSSGVVSRMLFSFVFTLSASALFLKIVEKTRYRNAILIPLVGLMFAGILGSISTFIAVQKNIVQDTNAWMIGDFSSILEGRYELIYLSLPAVLLTYLYANKFTVLGMGEDVSRNLGLNYRRVMNLGLFCVSLTVSTIVITAGAIPFLGLVIPNIISMLMGDNLRKTLHYIALLGAIFVIICDIIGRIVIYPFEIPIGLMVGIVGGVIFLVLLLKKR